MDAYKTLHTPKREQDMHLNFLKLFKNSPIPDDEFLQNLPTYLSRQSLSELLFLDSVYKQIIDVHGVIMEFGVLWGKNISVFSNLRGIYEPFNYNRKIIGFDTFKGFLKTTQEDGTDVHPGDWHVVEGYRGYLEKVLEYHQHNAPLGHIPKYELVSGDASQTVHEYLRNNQETIVALAYFDMDLYEPTKECLLALRSRLTKGSIVVFDEINHPSYPGETLAVQEVLGLDSYAIKRFPYQPTSSYIVIE